MTHIRFYRDARGRLSGYSIIGHAGSAPAGEDIVCAGISALTQTGVNALSAIAEARPRLHYGDGFLSVRLPATLSRRQRHRARVILRTVEQGLYDMAAAYPEYMRISRH